MRFRKEEAYLHTLCIELTADAFHFSIVNTKSKKIVEKGCEPLTHLEKAVVAEKLKNEMFTADFEAVVVSYAGARCTLIPVDLFAHTKPIEAFKLNYPEPIDNLDYNRIPELGVVAVYEMPLWLKSIVVKQFPRSKIVHRSTVLLKGVFDRPTFSPKIHVHIDTDHFYMVITKKSKLDYYNRFDYKELPDLIYYILFVLEQKEYEQKEFELNLYGVAPDWKDRAWFQSFFANPIKIASEPENGLDFTRAKQLLCV